MNVKYVSSSHGDWVGVYLNGKLYDEGHSIPVHTWLDLLSEVAEENSANLSTMQFEVGGEWLESCGNLSEFFSDIPKEQLA